jgi:hypothetical protein
MHHNSSLFFKNIMNAGQRLSARDTGVLNLLFDPEAQLTGRYFDLMANPTPEPLNEEELAEVQLVERRAIQLAEGGSVQEAEELLSQSIQRYPNKRPSLWNNRAQVRRLSRDVAGALDDLSQTIRIATPLGNTTASSYNAKVLSFAHTHRATIYMLVAMGEISGVLKDESPERLEEYASHDFAMAGKYGCELARAMAVRTNPYAKLCGAIVQTALKNEMQPLV